MEDLKGSRWKTIGFVVFALIQILVLIGCGAPTQRQEVSEDFQVSTQKQLLEKAWVDSDQGRDTQAINELNQFLSAPSHSAMEREARWLLAKSYRRSGKPRAALTQYMILAHELPPGKEQKEVRERMEELRRWIEKPGPQVKPTSAVRVSVTQFTLLGDVPATIKELDQGGVSTVLIDFGCPDDPLRKSRAAVKKIGYFHSELPSKVAQIHQYGLQAFVGLNLRCLGHIDPRSKDQWRDGFYDPVSGKVHASPYFDIFHPGYQDWLFYQLKTLVYSGIDGIVFLAEVPLGTYDGLAPGAVKLFNKKFHSTVTPQSLFTNGPNAQRSPSRSPGNHYAVTASGTNSDFWRWAGWKARQRLSVLQRLIDRVHEYKPTIPFGLELHPQTIMSPVQALMQFSEDFLEASHKNFRFFLVSPQAYKTNQLPPATFDMRDFINQNRKLVDRMAIVTTDLPRIWISIPSVSRLLPAEVSDWPEATYLKKVSRVYDLKALLDK